MVADPFEIENLAGDARYAEQLLAMRAALRSELVSTRDTGFIPEGMLQRLAAKGTIHAYARSDAYPIERLVDLADRAFDRWLGTFWERDWKRPGAAHGHS